MWAMVKTGYAVVAKSVALRDPEHCLSQVPAFHYELGVSISGKVPPPMVPCPMGSQGCARTKDGRHPQPVRG